MCSELKQSGIKPLRGIGETTSGLTGLHHEGQEDTGVHNMTQYQGLFQNLQTLSLTLPCYLTLNKGD
jgi:hypothetical protein